MKIDDIPRGQLSTIILMTLSERDKYGYEIIDEVLKNTNGKVSIKQPSLYSSLKRMEEQKLISSYWRDSEMGGKRHYYHLTDLGKWKNDIPENFQSTAKKNENGDGTKVLQQENLFSINKKVSLPEDNPIIENKKDDAYVQFDLFSNSTIVAPPCKEEKVEIIQDIAKTENPNENDKLINPILTSYEKRDEGNKISFEYVKKTNKSFSDSFKSANPNYQKKYVDNSYLNNDAQTIKNDSLENQKSDVIENNVLEIPVENEPQMKNEIPQEETENKIESLLNLSNLKGYIGKNKDNIDTTPIMKNDEKIKENKQDDGVLITERLNIEDMPKPTKWDTHRFEVYVDANSVIPDIKRKSNYEDRVKDLYEKSKSNSENQELEMIDNKIKFDNYKSLQQFYLEQNIKFKPFNKALKKTEKDYNMLRINKLKMLSSTSVLLYVALISTIFGIIYSNSINVKINHPITYIVFPVIASLYFLYNLIVYLKSPQKRIAFDLTKFNINYVYLTISIMIIPVIFAINLIFGFSFKNFYNYSLSLLYPICLTLTYLVYYATQKIILKNKTRLNI